MLQIAGMTNFIDHLVTSQVESQINRLAEMAAARYGDDNEARLRWQIKLVSTFNEAWQTAYVENAGPNLDLSSDNLEKAIAAKQAWLMETAQVAYWAALAKAKSDTRDS